MSGQPEDELEQLMIYITNGESNHEQLRKALCEPLLKRWNLATHLHIPKNSQGNTLFSWAIQNKNTTALEMLMKNLELEHLPEEPALNGRPAEKSNLPYIAVENYHEPTWNFVLQRIDIERLFDQLGKSKTTVLHAAANRNIADIFRTLHKNIGSKLEDKLFAIRDGHKQTVLHVAASRPTYDGDASRRCFDTIIELLKIQPKLIKAQDKDGETVLHKAVTANQKTLLQHLLTVDATILSKCDKNNDSAFILFRKKRANSDHIQNVSRKDVESFRGISRTSSFNEEIGTILHKAILGLDTLNISQMRQLLFKDEPGGFGPELKWDLSTFDIKNMNFQEYLRVPESNNFNTSFYETLKVVELPDLSCTGGQPCDATTHGLRNSSEANVIFSHLESKRVKHIIEVVVPDCMVHPHANRHIISALRPFNVRRLKWRKLDLGVKTIAMAAPEVEVLTLYSSGDKDALSQWVGIDGLCQLPKLHTIHITIFRGEDDDVELENTRRQCEEVLLGHRIHSQHDRTFHMVCENGSWKVEQSPCGCQRPRFLHSRINIELEPLPVASRRSDERLPRHQNHLRQGTVFDRLLPLRNFISGLDGLKADSRVDRDYLRKKPVKVAVLDSGVYADSGQFPALTGASFIEDITNGDSHWHTATNPHGTIMASLIRKLDPTCHILAARTHHGSDMQGGDVNATIKALEWAVNHKADIICISWTCAGEMDDNDVGNLETKVQEAAKNSLIFCATGDKGPSAKESYPAGFKTPFKICSCSISGQPAHNAEIDNTEFYVPAENLDVAVPKYLNLGDKRAADGSSAATAIAAGLATLVLSLARFAYYRLDDDSSEPEADDSDDSDIKGDYSERWALLPQVEQAENRVAQLKKRSIMERVFKHMCCSSDKFVQPWEVFPMDLIGRDFDEAKKSVAEFLDRASKRLL